MAMKTLDESDVGIFRYISSLPGFRGILKQRYSDFIVNEVDTDGKVVQLSSLDTPAEAMHNFFKENFKFLFTDTVDGPVASSKCIRVRLNSGGPNNRGRNSKKRKEKGDKPFDSRGSENWLENVGKFLRFHLYKENKDTQEALGVIGDMLVYDNLFFHGHQWHLGRPRSFGFAGTKDKRAVSTQRVTVYKQQASRLASLNERFIGIKVGDFCYVKEGLLLGQLLGNRFTITLRCLRKVVTAEDLNSRYYTIDDVILPMPGSQVIYPTNDIAKVYHDLAKKDGISLTESVHNVKDFSITIMTGSYRRVLQKPINFEWELLTYTDNSKPLVETDLDKIGKSNPINNVKPVGAPNGNKEEVFDSTRQLESSNDGQRLR